MVLARRVLLVVVALVFVAIAVMNVIMPAAAAKNLGLAATSVDGLSELRAVYVGVWLATAAIFALAARRADDESLHLAATLLLGGQVLGRSVSLVLDGAPSAQVVPLFIVETVGTIALIALRPRGRGAQRSH